VAFGTVDQFAARVQMVPVPAAVPLVTLPVPMKYRVAAKVFVERLQTNAPTRRGSKYFTKLLAIVRSITWKGETGREYD